MEFIKLILCLIPLFYSVIVGVNAWNGITMGKVKVPARFGAHFLKEKPLGLVIGLVDIEGKWARALGICYLVFSLIIGFLSIAVIYLSIQDILVN